MKDDLDKIVWPTNPALKDMVQWERNVACVRILTEACTVFTWLTAPPGADSYIYMPYKYVHESAKDVVIQFCPHWLFYRVGNFSLQVPNSLEEVLQAIQAFKTLRHLGY